MILPNSLCVLYPLTKTPVKKIHNNIKPQIIGDHMYVYIYTNEQNNILTKAYLQAWFDFNVRLLFLLMKSVQNECLFFFYSFNAFKNEEQQLLYIVQNDIISWLIIILTLNRYVAKNHSYKKVSEYCRPMHILQLYWYYSSH